MVDMEMTMTSLASYLRDRNAQTEAWIAEDPDNRWAGLLTEDLAHWAEIGVFTVEDFQRYDLIQLIWEMYRDVTGIRPRHMDFDSMSLADLQQEADYLGRQIERSIQEDAEWEADLMAFAQEDAEEENKARDEAPLPIDYVACHYQEGWL